MSHRRTYKTDRFLWVIFAMGIFVAFGFVDFAGKDPNTLWAHAGILLTGSYRCSDMDMLVPVGFHVLILAAPATLFGWALQAIAVVCGVRLSGHMKPLEAADYDDAALSRTAVP